VGGLMAAHFHLWLWTLLAAPFYDRFVPQSGHLSDRGGLENL